jgi:predicted nucleic acid-binding Zn ribbon protein
MNNIVIMSAYEHGRTTTYWGRGTRDVKLRCMKCGSFAGGSPMCDECAEEVMREVERRRRRMQIVFYYILFLAVAAYYLIL